MMTVHGDEDDNVGHIVASDQRRRGSMGLGTVGKTLHRRESLS